MKELDKKIIELPYDFKILILKIYILYNPKIIFDIYFSDNYLKIGKKIQYSGFVRGVYWEEKKIYSLYNLIFQYELFKLKFRDIPTYYKNVKDENECFLYNIKDIIEYLLIKSKKKYNNYKLDISYIGDIDYSFKEIIKLDLYEEDLNNEGWDYNGNIGQCIQNNNFIIETYMENCRNIEVPFNIIYRF